MDTVEVVAAIIVRGYEVFVAKRGRGEYTDVWEFPGGRVEEGETPRAALKRQIRDTLGLEISVGDEIRVIEFDYPTYHLKMHCFSCSILSGYLSLKKHKEVKWISENGLDSVEWVPSDREILPLISELHNM